MHKTKHHQRAHHLEDGNHHLASAVVGLTAIFLALGIYAFVYANRPKPASNTNIQTAPSITNANQVPSTPTGRTSFVGIIREVNDSRLSVRTSVTQNGLVVEQFILTTITPTTDIGRLGEVQLIISDDPGTSRTRTPATVSDLKVGTGVEVFSPEVIDGKTAVTASKIDILTASQ